MKGCTNREMRKLLAAAIDSGIEHRMTKGGVLFYGPNGVDCVSVHFTSSDHRAYKNALANFRKIGFDYLEKRAS